MVSWVEARRRAWRVEQTEELEGLAEGLGDHELIVLVTVARALTAGREEYGNLDIWMDVRDFGEEAHEEAIDDLIYRAIHWLRRRGE